MDWWELKLRWDFWIATREGDRQRRVAGTKLIDGTWLLPRFETGEEIHAKKRFEQKIKALF
jgi:hypothetical protein